MQTLGFRVYSFCLYILVQAMNIRHQNIIFNFQTHFFNQIFIHKMGKLAWLGTIAIDYIVQQENFGCSQFANVLQSCFCIDVVLHDYRIHHRRHITTFCCNRITKLPAAKIIVFLSLLYVNYVSRYQHEGFVKPDGRKKMCFLKLGSSLEKILK